jgi:hypothetical protein
LSKRTAFNLALGAILVPFLAACLFAHPIADDFIYASNGRVGFWGAWLREYAGWNGRYASNALLLSTPLTFGSLAGYRLAAAVMLMSTIAASYLFVRALAGRGLTRQEALACSLTLSVLYFSQTPSLAESVYWYTSAAVYQAPLVLVLLHLSLVIRYAAGSPVSGVRPTMGDRLSLALAAVLLIAVAGFNEVIMLMMLVLYGALWVRSLREGGSLSSLYGGLFALTVACGLGVLLSPGNAARQSMYPTHHQISRSLGMTALQTLRFTSVWASSGALLLATVLFVPLADALVRRHLPEPRRAARYLRLSLTGLLLVVPIAVFPAYWETGILGQHRTVNTAFFAFLILWFVTVAMWLASGTRPANAVKLFGYQVRLPLAVLLLTSLALTGNSYVVGFDLISGRFAAFDREMDRREATLEACRDRRQATCDIEAIHVRPASFYVVDVSPDPANWVNVSYARYFKVSEVRLKN